jgi:hypothetical protein
VQRCRSERPSVGSPSPTTVLDNDLLFYIALMARKIGALTKRLKLLAPLLRGRKSLGERRRKLNAGVLWNPCHAFSFRLCWTYRLSRAHLHEFLLLLCQ